MKRHAKSGQFGNAPHKRGEYKKSMVYFVAKCLTRAKQDIFYMWASGCHEVEGQFFFITCCWRCMHSQIKFFELGNKESWTVLLAHFIEKRGQTVWYTGR